MKTLQRFTLLVVKLVNRAMSNLLIWLVFFRHPSEKYEFVSWDHYPQYMEKIKHVPNHQQVMQTKRDLHWMIQKHDTGKSWKIDE